MIIRVAIVEDDPSVRNGLVRLCETSPKFTCVGAAESGERALAILPGKAPDVVLMDLHLPGKSGIEAVRELKLKLPATQFIMLTIEEDSERVFQAIRAGATGYLVKSVPADKILEAISEVHRGGSPVSSQIARLLVRAFQPPPPVPAQQAVLTAREAQILALLARGYRSKEAADELGIGVPTVNTHLRNIYEKLQVRSRAEAVAHFIRREHANKR